MSESLALEEAQERIVQSAREPTTESVVPSQATSDISAGTHSGVDPIVNSAQDLPGKLYQSMGDIAQAIEASSNNSFVDSILITIAGGLVGAFAAFIFSHLHWKLIRKKSVVTEIATTLQGVISELESTAVEYWLTDFEESKKVESQTQEIRMKSTIVLVDKYSNLLLTKSTNNRDSVEQHIAGLPDYLYDLALGGTFESHLRKASKQTASKIAKRCASVRAELSELTALY